MEKKSSLKKILADLSRNYLYKETFDVNYNNFIKEAYEAPKYAFVFEL